MTAQQKYRIATAIAVLFHAIGLSGILWFDRELFTAATAFNLMLMFVLILFTHGKITTGFLIFFLVAFVIGIGVEIIGTETGILFGDYSYGNVLGPKIRQVPIMIGFNWFIVIYCCGMFVQRLLTKIIDRMAEETEKPKQAIRALSVIIDGATIAVLFDWIMEPVAVQLGYWSWETMEIPFLNYVCWFLVSCMLMAVFHYARFQKQNKFAVNLLLIQMMFFLLLRTFL
jgi:putative membrane protein